MPEAIPTLIGVVKQLYICRSTFFEGNKLPSLNYRILDSSEAILEYHILETCVHDRLCHDPLKMLLTSIFLQTSCV